MKNCANVSALAIRELVANALIHQIFFADAGPMIEFLIKIWKSPTSVAYWSRWLLVISIVLIPIEMRLEHDFFRPGTACSGRRI